MDDSGDFSRLPPHDLEAEMCLLGSLMLLGDDGAVAFARVQNLINREAFFSADHQILFDAVCSLHKDRAAIDAVTIRAWLVQRNLYEEIGGREMLAKVLNKVPSAAHYMSYMRIVQGKHKLRQAIALATDISRKCYEAADNTEAGMADAILSGASAKASEIILSGKADEVYLLGDVLPEILAKRGNGGAFRALSGFTSLDAVLGGWAYGQKHLIGGKPGMGKSAMMKVCAKHLAESGIPTGIISIEEKRQKIAENLLSGESGIPNNRIAHGTAAREEWQEMDRAVQRLSSLPLYIVDSARRLSAIAAMAKLLVLQYGVRAVMVDHLHIIDGEPQRNENRNLEISRISAALKWVWKDLNVIGIEAAQLNRGSGRDRPTLDSLRDSGSLEQDGDVVLLLHREDYYERDNPDHQPDNVLEVIVAKNKDGATGIVPLHYDESCYHICDLREQSSYTPDEASRIFS